MQCVSGKRQTTNRMLWEKVCCLICPDAYACILLVINNGFDDHKRYGQHPAGLSGRFLINRQAFWLKDQPTNRAFPVSQWYIAAFVPLYSNGWFAMDSNHLSLLTSHHQF